MRTSGSRTSYRPMPSTSASNPLPVPPPCRPATPATHSQKTCALPIPGPRALLQELFEDLEAQVVAFGDAEALVAVRERLVVAGAAVAAALVEGDQFVADVDHGHAHVGQPPVVAHDAFALGQQRLADAAALQARHDGETADRKDRS